MGKIKIGEIYNKPIVEGDKNLVNKNEIHKSELQGNGGSDTSGALLKFYKVKNEYNKNEELANWLYNYCAYWTVTSDNYTNVNRHGPDKRFNVFAEYSSNDNTLKAFAIYTDIFDESVVTHFNENILDKVEEISYNDFMYSIDEY